MWIFTRYGFYSAVCARQGDGRHHQPVDPDRIMVRARSRGHLEGLIGRFPELLAGAEVKSFAGSDYPHRIFIPKSVWVAVLGALGEDLDYDNFKDEAGRHEESTGSAYVHALHRVWHDMLPLQRS
ncbi:MAG: hypothetical protein DYG94_10005 [Leptolyngbya sp. PLA3]|nr:MAG: hypothetical protein EDM82_05150 [Cyanobacteria bacterium CYA]MCE7969064.1 hypothetical protein [Leptolyngbya sp. PL-A3]